MYSTQEILIRRVYTTRPRVEWRLGSFLEGATMDLDGEQLDYSLDPLKGQLIWSLPLGACLSNGFIEIATNSDSQVQVSQEEVVGAVGMPSPESFTSDLDNSLFPLLEDISRSPRQVTIMGNPPS
jgi:hypothetical protein